jgi:hypothetical protein
VRACVRACVRVCVCESPDADWAEEVVEWAWVPGRY